MARRAHVRRLAIPVAALLLAASGCKTVLDFVPVSAAAVRAGMQEVDARGHATLVDAEGHAHAVDSSTTVRTSEQNGAGLAAAAKPGAPRDLAELSRICGGGRPCPLDSGGATWEIGAPRRVPDGDAIQQVASGVLFVGGLVTGNVACFGTNVCSDGIKTTVVVIDVVLVASLAGVLLVALAFGNRRW